MSDLDADGESDLVLYDRQTGQCFWVVGQADGTFSYPQAGFWAPDWTLNAGDMFVYNMPGVGYPSDGL